MVIITKDDDGNITGYKEEFPSWMKLPENLSETQLTYLDLLQDIFLVKNAAGEWVPYRMANHQVQFHLLDAVLTQENAKHTWVKKSRGTAFTTCMRIRNIMAASEFVNPTVPFVRLNSMRSFDFIDEVKDQIRHIKPITYDMPDESRRISPDIDPPMKRMYIPFNPNAVNMEARGTIKFANGTKFTAFPANATASESIRGIRTRGDAGDIDEANFMQKIESIWIALRDSNAGVDTDGKMCHQITVGSTMKGQTEYARMVKNVEQGNSPNVVLLSWPIFNQTIFEHYGYHKKDAKDLIPFYENNDLVLLAFWFSKKVLWNMYTESFERFMEEYMAIQVDSDYQWYPTQLILSRALRDNPEDFHTVDYSKYHKIRIGVDPASVNDMFAIYINGVYGNKKEGLFVSNETQVDLEIKQQELDDMITFIKGKNENLLVTIDATPIGLQLTQSLQYKHGGIVRGVTGNKVVKTHVGTNFKLNEFMHTEMKRALQRGEMDLINDEMLINHFQSIDGDFKILRDSFGHGDSCMAAGYSMLPDDLTYAHTNSDLPAAVDKNSFVDNKLRNRLDEYRKQKQKSKLKPAY